MTHTSVVPIVLGCLGFTFAAVGFLAWLLFRGPNLKLLRQIPADATSWPEDFVELVPEKGRGAVVAVHRHYVLCDERVSLHAVTFVYLTPRNTLRVAWAYMTSPASYWTVTFRFTSFYALQRHTSRKTVQWVKVKLQERLARIYCLISVYGQDVSLLIDSYIGPTEGVCGEIIPSRNNNTS